MGRLRAASLLLAALAAGLLLAACGSSGKGELLPGTTADQITANLAQVRETFNEGNCEAAEDAVAQVSTEVDELQKVDKKLKSALKQGAVKLSEVVSTCSQGEEEENEEAQAAEEAEAEQEAIQAGEAEAEEEAFEKEQKAEEKAQEKAEKQAEQPEPPQEGEESGAKGKGKGHEGQEETVKPSPEEEVIPPGAGGGGAGGIGPGAPVEGEG